MANYKTSIPLFNSLFQTQTLFKVYIELEFHIINIFFVKSE